MNLKTSKHTQCIRYCWHLNCIYHQVGALVAKPNYSAYPNMSTSLKGWIILCYVSIPSAKFFSSHYYVKTENLVYAAIFITSLFYKS